MTQTTPAPAVEVVVPVYNEERDLAPSVLRLHRYLSRQFPFTFRITIADNASTDGTWTIARRLVDELPEVHAVHLPEKGRGRALKQVWLRSDATVLAYMDVDLSTDLSALLPLVAPLMTGHSDLAIGSRLSRTSRVVRGPKRELVSRTYNMILHATLGTGFPDAQCGFKAIRADRARVLLPQVEDDGWFFDTELLVLAERCGLRISEVPVDWVDDPDSRVDVVATAKADLRGIARVGWDLARGRIPVEEMRAELGTATVVPSRLSTQLWSFATVGVASTLAYLLLFLVLRGPLGSQGANLASLLVTAVLNTAANRRFTFGVRGRADAMRHQVQGLLVFAAALGLTSGSLALLHAAAPAAPALVELSVLVLANLTATVLRFVALRGWVFAHRVKERPVAVGAPGAAGARTAGRAPAGRAPLGTAPGGARLDGAGLDGADGLDGTFPGGAAVVDLPAARPALSSMGRRA